LDGSVLEGGFRRRRRGVRFLEQALDLLSGLADDVLLDLRAPIKSMREQAKLHPERKEKFAYLSESDFLEMGFSDERGLLGLAFHPEDRDLFYAFYSAPPFDNRSDHQSIVASFERSGERDPVKTFMSQVVHFRTDEKQFNHNGGMLAFGPDGHLYVGTGDGGGFDDMPLPLVDRADPESFLGNAQNPASPNGKILRFAVANGTGRRRLEAAGSPDSRELSSFWRLKPHKALWHLGLRNPWRFSFDRETGAMIVADVGQSESEEVSVARPGESGVNFGWRAYEGEKEFAPGAKARALLKREGVEVRLPSLTYGRDEGIAVIGGHVYRGKIRDLRGKYVFGDYAGPKASGGKIFAADFDVGDPRMTLRDRLATFEGEDLHSFAEDNDGELYAFTVTRFGRDGKRVGRIYKMVEDGGGEGETGSEDELF
jgi:glucose/arabinose dehydrogenase